MAPGFAGSRARGQICVVVLGATPPTGPGARRGRGDVDGGVPAGLRHGLPLMIWIGWGGVLRMTAWPILGHIALAALVVLACR
jgi:hypothetical protein